MNNQWRENANMMVVWADGTYDSKRSCDECGSETCKYPVHSDRYKEVGQTQMDINEAERAMGYWEWMHTNQPLGGKHDFDGEFMVSETTFANPDGLCSHNQHPDKCDFCRGNEFTRNSGVTQIQDVIAHEAFNQLTPKQKIVWQLVMREQLSQTEAARRLGVTQSTLKTHLNRAKFSFTNYLRSQEHRVIA